MKSSHRVRIILVKFAKVFPFIICAILFILYAECFIALSTCSYATFGNEVSLYTPIAWFVSSFYEYGIYSIVVAIVLAIAMETCIYNKLAILYLLIHLWSKHYLSSVELYEHQIYAIVIANLLVSIFFVWKGVRILTTK